MRKLVTSTLGRAALIAGVLCLGTVGWGIAQAASTPNAGPAHPYGVSGTGGGMPPTAQVLWAVINSDGSKARSFPGNTTSIHASGTGEYNVFFYENVSSCSFQATVGQPISSGIAEGYATAEGMNANPKGVWVSTFNSAGASTDEPFHLAVTC